MYHHVIMFNIFDNVSALHHTSPPSASMPDGHRVRLFHSPEAVRCFFLGGGRQKLWETETSLSRQKNNQETDFHVEDFIDHDQQFD